MTPQRRRQGSRPGARDPIPAPTAIAVTAPLRKPAAAAPVAAVEVEVSDAATEPFAEEATSTDGPGDSPAGYAWLDDTPIEPRRSLLEFGTLDVEDLHDVSDATVDQALEAATQPPPTTRSPS